MNEFDLLILFDEYEDSFVGMMQWWASISLAVMVVAHFVGDKLRLPFVLGILILYSGFTFMIQLLLAGRAEDLAGIVAALIALDTLTQAGQARADTEGSALLFITLIFSYWGTYLAAVSYLLWRFVIANRQRARRLQA